MGSSLQLLVPVGSLLLSKNQNASPSSPPLCLCCLWCWKPWKPWLLQWSSVSSSSSSSSSSWLTSGFRASSVSTGSLITSLCLIFTPSFSWIVSVLTTIPLTITFLMVVFTPSAIVTDSCVILEDFSLPVALLIMSLLIFSSIPSFAILDFSSSSFSISSFVNIACLIS